MHDDKTVTFHIDAFTPATIPMAKLASYMADFATLLGAEERVHFKEVSPGSTILHARVEFESVPAVRERLRDIGSGGSGGGAARAFARIDDRLANDNAAAWVSIEGDQQGAVLRFPGRPRPPPQIYGPFTQDGQLEGLLVSIGGTTDSVNVHLQDETRLYRNCDTTRQVARDLRHHLFEPIRAFGSGRWVREPGGTWTMRAFHIRAFDVLDGSSLADVVAALHKVRGGDWSTFPDASSELAALRLDDEA